jgi:hypothetical protein
MAKDLSLACLAEGHCIEHLDKIERLFELSESEIIEIEQDAGLFKLSKEKLDEINKISNQLGKIASDKVNDLLQ